MGKHSVPLLTVKGVPYAIEYLDTETRSHADYSLTRSNEGGPEVDSSSLPIQLAHKGGITVVDSITSGTGRENRDIYRVVLEPIFRELGVTHTYLPTESKNTITDFAEALDLSKPQTVIFISGDTSISEFINGLYKQDKRQPQQDVYLSVLPFGSGNGLGWSSGLSDEVDAIQKLFTSNTNAPLQLYRAQLPEGSYQVDGTPMPSNEMVFSVVVTFAMHAKLVWLAEQPDLRDMGIDRFKVAAGMVAREPMDFHVAIETADGEKLTTTDAHGYLNVFACPYIERGYLISPGSKLYNRDLHILHIDDLPPQDLMPIMVMPYQGEASTHTQLPAVQYKQVDEDKDIVVTLLDTEEEKSNICVDGCIFRVKDPKGKTVKLSGIKEDELSFKLNFVGLQRD